MGYTVLAWWRAEPGAEDEIARLLGELAGPSRAEPGCLEYRVHRNPEDPADFFIYEQYRDEAAFAAHHASEHFQGIAVERALPLLADRTRQIYLALEAPATGTGRA